MLEFREVSFAYRRRKNRVKAVSGLTFSVGEGELCAVTGPSGCGKSTLLRLAGGLLRPDSGSVLLDGQTPDPRRVSIGLLSQGYGLLAWKTVLDNILLPFTLRHEKPSPQALSEILGTLGLSDLLDRYPAELSGGQRQRVALARVFVRKPDLLLLDAPFAALDLLTAEKSRALFRQIWERYRITALLVTHNPAEAASLAEKILLLRGTNPGVIHGLFGDLSESELRNHLSGI